MQLWRQQSSDGMSKNRTNNLKAQLLCWQAAINELVVVTLKTKRSTVLYVLGPTSNEL